MSVNSCLLYDGEQWLVITTQMEFRCYVSGVQRLNWMANAYAYRSCGCLTVLLHSMSEAFIRSLFLLGLISGDENEDETDTLVCCRDGLLESGLSTKASARRHLSARRRPASATYDPIWPEKALRAPQRSNFIECLALLHEA